MLGQGGVPGAPRPELALQVMNDSRERVLLPHETQI